MKKVSYFFGCTFKVFVVKLIDSKYKGKKNMTILSIQNIDDFFTDLFKKLGETFTIQTFIVLLIGIILGFVICGALYGLMMIFSLKSEQTTRKDKKLNITPNNEKIIKEVEEIKSKFLETSEGFTMKERFQYLGSTVMETINVVAAEYYPESKYPLYELTIEELIVFLRYLSYRIEEVFNKPFLKVFKKMTISQVFRFMETRKKISDNKAVKAATKLNSSKFKQIIMGIVNYANPIYWIKKLVVGTTINIAVRKMCIVIIDIVSDETNKTYSKVIFNKEQQIYQEEINRELQQIEEDMKNE